MSEPVYINTPREQRNVSDCTGCQNLSNQINTPKSDTPEKCVRLYRMSEPVYISTPREQRNVSDCTGCQNLSKSTHQESREMCQIVQDVRTCLNQHTKRTEKCVRLRNVSDWAETGVRTCTMSDTLREQRNVSDCTGCQNLSKSTHQERCQRNVSDCTGCQNLSISAHQESREMCQIVQDVRTCLNQHTKRAEKCVRLYRMSEPV